MKKTYIIRPNAHHTDGDHHDNGLVQVDTASAHLIPLESNKITSGSGT